MRTRQLQRRTSVAQVLDAAERLFATFGFVDTTVKDIAAAAGLSVGTVMSVGDKNALLVSVFDDRIAKIHSARPAVTTAQTAPCAERLTLLFTPFAELFTRQPELSRSYASILVSGQHSSRVFSELAATLTDEIAAELDRCSRACGVADATLEATRARAIYLAYLGLLFTWPPELDADTGALLTALQQLSESQLPTCRCRVAASVQA
ncbi:TetR/AcrR family transcriptional regulator [Leucobacter albus]|uniref:TetR/AcrR family transcriptional regulator n=1 Tax=Leucobacter albus TaxID=272210 RepID=A0ABW3TLV3_9MICO